MPTPPWAPVPPLHPRGLSPWTPHEGGPSPPSPACPLLLRPCGHGRAWWLGGRLCQRTRRGLFRLFARQGEELGGPAPSLPPFPPPPPGSPQSGLLDRPSQWAALLKLGPESSLPHFGGERLWGKGGGRGAKVEPLSAGPQCPGHLPGCVTAKKPEGPGPGRGPGREGQRGPGPCRTGGRQGPRCWLQPAEEQDTRPEQGSWGKLAPLPRTLGIRGARLSVGGSRRNQD